MSTETKTLTNADAKIQPKLGVTAPVQGAEGQHHQICLQRRRNGRAFAGDAGCQGEPL